MFQWHVCKLAKLSASIAKCMPTINKFYIYILLEWFNSESVADLGEGPGGSVPNTFWVKKEEITEGRKAGRASKQTPFPPSPLAQGLDPPLRMTHK